MDSLVDWKHQKQIWKTPLGTTDGSNLHPVSIFASSFPILQKVEKKPFHHFSGDTSWASHFPHTHHRLWAWLKGFPSNKLQNSFQVQPDSFAMFSWVDGSVLWLMKTAHELGIISPQTSEICVLLF